MFLKNLLDANIKSLKSFKTVKVILCCFCVCLIYTGSVKCLTSACIYGCVCVLVDWASSQDSDGDKSDDNLVVDVSNEVSSLSNQLASRFF